MPYVMDVAVPTAHKLSFTKLEKSHSEHVCMGRWVWMPLIAVVSERHHTSVSKIPYHA